MMTIKRIRQHVLDACHSKSDNVADFKQPDSVPYIVSAVIADTSYPATHIPQVLQFMQGYLGTAKDLESCVRWATLMLLRSSEGVSTLELCFFHTNTDAMDFRGD